MDDSIDKIFGEVSAELEMQKYALDQAAIVAVTDQKGNIIYINDKFCEISKYNKEELLGKNHRILKSGYHGVLFYEDLWKTISEGKTWSGQIKNRAKDGTFYWVQTTIIPFLNEQNKPYKFLSIRFDITELKALESSLEDLVLERTLHLMKANERIEKMVEMLSTQNKQLQNFCNIVSHDLRAPLGNLVMLVELIEDCVGGEDQKMLISNLRPTMNNLHRTFDELIEATLIKQDKEILSEKVDLEQSVNRVIKDLEGGINKFGVKLDTDFSEAPFVNYPSKYMASILSNLIGNAIKYRSPLRNSEILIKTKKKGEKVILSVSDNGLGINLDINKNRLFRMRGIVHAHPEARGFGLFLTRTQVESMGGNIWVESEEGKGSVFFVEFQNQ